MACCVWPDLPCWPEPMDVEAAASTFMAWTSAGGAGGEGGGGAGDTSLLYTSPRVDRDLGDVQQGEHRLHQPWHHLLHHHS